METGGRHEAPPLAEMILASEMEKVCFPLIVSPLVGQPSPVEGLRNIWARLPELERCFKKKWVG